MYTFCTLSFIFSISRVFRQTVAIISIFVVPSSFSPYVPSVPTDLPRERAWEVLWGTAKRNAAVRMGKNRGMYQWVFVQQVLRSLYGNNRRKWMLSKLEGEVASEGEKKRAKLLN